MGSGVIAISLADTLFHASLNRVGAGINAIVDTFYSPFTLLFAYLMLGETLGGLQILGMVLIMAAVLVSTRIKVPAGASRRTLVVGRVSWRGGHGLPGLRHRFWPSPFWNTPTWSGPPPCGNSGPSSAWRPLP